MIYLLLALLVLIPVLNYYWVYIRAGILGSYVYYRKQFHSYLREQFKEDSFTIERKDNYCILKYLEDGETKELYIPLDISQNMAASQSIIEVIVDKDHKYEICQDPEMPILVTANDLGANSIVVTNNFTGEVHAFHDNDKVHFYL
jgi:hypothetical protein